MLLPTLNQLGRDHRRYGVRPEHYDVFGRALVAALRYHAKDVWVPELEDAWNKAYALVADACRRVRARPPAREPAWWKGEIVAHERRAEDIAVIVVRPDRHYDYEPGQFASIETPYRPRSWRTYSMATAPSADGLLEFHVRTVGAGWVSGPLVWRAQVGDVLRSARRPARCGSTSSPAATSCAWRAAPAWRRSRRWSTGWPSGTPRAGSRCSSAYAGPLISTTSMPAQLESMNSWLTVVPVVSDEPAFDGEQGRSRTWSRVRPVAGP